MSIIYNIKESIPSIYAHLYSDDDIINFNIEGGANFETRLLEKLKEELLNSESLSNEKHIIYDEPFKEGNSSVLIEYLSDDEVYTNLILDITPLK